MLDAGIIKPCKSEWSFPVVIATKKDGKPRFCVDYRILNKKTRADRYPLSSMDETIDDLQGAEVYTNLEMLSGYWQLLMDSSCKEMTTFICKLGTFWWEVMPFGLMNAPAIFQRAMNEVFRHLPFVRVYLDDLVIFSKNMAEHLGHLKKVSELLAKKHLKIKLKNCAFAQIAVRLLGHAILRKEVDTNPLIPMKDENERVVEFQANLVQGIETVSRKDKDKTFTGRTRNFEKGEQGLVARGCALRDPPWPRLKKVLWPLHGRGGPTPF